MNVDLPESMTEKEKRQTLLAWACIMTALASVGVEPVAPPDIKPVSSTFDMVVWVQKRNGRPFDLGGFLAAFDHNGNMRRAAFTRLEYVSFDLDGVVSYYLTFRLLNEGNLFTAKRKRKGPSRRYGEVRPDYPPDEGEFFEVNGERYRIITPQSFK